MPNLIKEFNRYGELSGYKINMQKSEALDINLPGNVKKQLRRSFSFRWAKPAIKYLGVKIPAKIKDVGKLNFLPLLEQIEEDLVRSWYVLLARMEQHRQDELAAKNLIPASGPPGTGAKEIPGEMSEGDH